jgi:hypothetical protein
MWIRVSINYRHLMHNKDDRYKSRLVEVNDKDINIISKGHV